MPLIDCPVCQHRISSEAEACPECGHPNRPTATEPSSSSGPKCHACSALATTRCQKCGTLSCATHLQSIYVSHGQGGAYELRCHSCYQSAMTGKIIGGVLFAIVALGILAVIANGM